MERLSRGPLGEVFRGYWHGEVAVKRFCLDMNASQSHLRKFKEEVRPMCSLCTGHAVYTLCVGHAVYTLCIELQILLVE